MSVTDDGTIQYVNMVYDAYLTNNCMLTFNLDDGTLYTSSSQLLGGALDISSLVPTVIPACDINSANGQIVFNIIEGVNVNIIWQPLPFTPVGGLVTNNGVTQLPGGISYLVVIQDATCTSTFDYFIEAVPVSPITYTIDQVTPVSLCTSQTVTASGAIPGSISGTISGGSGDFVVDWTSGVLNGLMDTEISISDIEVSDTYLFTITDNVTGCFLANQSVNVPSITLDLDLTIEELSPMITNGDMIAAGGPPANSIVVPGGLGSTLTILPTESYEIDYTWSLAGGVNANDGTYTEVAVEGNYVVAAQLNGSSCVVLSDPYSFSAEICLGNPDFNWDGVVNAGDLSAYLGQLGLSCECQADMNGDGFVNGNDWLIFISYWSALSPGCSN